jgi:PPOX class probable F420-dependent enzyme
MAAAPAAAAAGLALTVHGAAGVSGDWPAGVAALARIHRLPAPPRVASPPACLDGDQAVFMTSADTVKGRAILRDPRVSLCWGDERPPFSFVTIAGVAATSADPGELVRWAARSGGRYMRADRAEEFGRRSAVPPELVVRVTRHGLSPKWTSQMSASREY